MQYSIQVTRWSEDDESTILVDQYITADQAIDAIVFVQNLAPEEDTEDDEVVEEVEEIAVEPKVSAPKSERRKYAKYDRDALEADISSGKFGSKELMERHGISAPTLSRVKAMLRPAEDIPAGAGAVETAYVMKRKERDTIPTPETNVEGEIKLAFIQGFSIAEVSAMYPMVPMTELVKLKGQAND